MKINITFKSEFANFKMEGCTEFLRKRDVKATAEDLEGLGGGKLKQIVIDILEL